jgi:putative aldouronate transport system substrate-binding protein
MVFVLVGLAFSASASGVGDADATKERRTLRVEIFDRGNAPAEFLQGGKPAQWVQAGFGDANNVTVEWVPVTRSKEVEQLNLMMAAKTAPDLSFTYDTVLAGGYAYQGGLADLTDVMDRYGRTLKAFLGKDVLQYGVWNGRQFAIPGKRSLVGIKGTWIRKDWLDKLGLPIPRTRDEMLAALRAFRDKDPGKVGGNLVPLWVQDKGIDPNIMYSFYQLGSERDRAAWIGPASTILCQDIAVPGAKEGLRFHNMLYNEGLTTKDFWLYTDTAATHAAISNGYVGAFTNNQSYIWTYNLIPAIEKNNPDAFWVPCDPFTNKDGKTPKYIYAPIGIMNMVPSFSKNADLVVKYLDWMAHLPNLTKLMYGEKGVHYDIDSNGIIIPRKLSGADVWEFNLQDRSVILNGRPYETRDMVIKAMVLPYVSGKYTMDLFLSHYKMLEVDGVPPVRVENPPDSYLKLNTVVLNKGNQITAKVVAAKPEDFDAMYEAGLKEFLDLGARQIKEDLWKAFDEQKSK